MKKLILGLVTIMISFGVMRKNGTTHQVTMILAEVL